MTVTDCHSSSRNNRLWAFLGNGRPMGWSKTRRTNPPRTMAMTKKTITMRIGLLNSQLRSTVLGESSAPYMSLVSRAYAIRWALEDQCRLSVTK